MQLGTGLAADTALDPTPHFPRTVVVELARPSDVRTAFIEAATTNAAITSPKKILINSDPDFEDVLKMGGEGYYLFEPDPAMVPPGQAFDELFVFVGFVVPDLAAAIELKQLLDDLCEKRIKEAPKSEPIIRSVFIQGYFFSASGSAASYERRIGRQDYLLAARYGGVDGLHAWSKMATGAGEVIYVLEADCWLDHQDFIINGTVQPPTRSVLPTPGPAPMPDLLHCRQHGTAALGILVATRNTLGVRQGIVGIAHDATAQVALALPGPWSNPVQFSNMVATIYAKALSDPTKGAGAIVLLERCHTPPGSNLQLPLETDPFFRAVIKFLMHSVSFGGCGAVVVQPAGNSDADLDTHLSSPTGAIIVGACRSKPSYPPQLAGTPEKPFFAKTMLSNYSESNTLVHLFSWGENVHTSSVDSPWWLMGGSSAGLPVYVGTYTSMTGTSAAAAIIAGTASCIQSHHRKSGGSPLSCYQMIARLKTGAVECLDGEGIGVQPNLKEILP